MLQLQGGHDAVLHLAHQPELRVFLAACGLPPETLQRLSAAAALRRSETARARCANFLFYPFSIFLFFFWFYRT